MIQKVLPILVFCFCAMGSTFGQGLIIKAHGGYAIGVAKEEMGLYSYTDAATGLLVQETRWGNLGSGANFSLDVGYMITKHIGVQVGGNFFYGDNWLVVDVDSADLTGLGAYTTVDAIAYSRLGELIPAVVVSSGTSKPEIYGEFGVVIPFTGATLQETTGQSHAVADPPVSFQKAQNSGRFSLGFVGSIGASWAINDMLSVFAQLRMKNLRIKVTQKTLLESTVDGVSNMESQAEWQLTTNYHDKLDPSLNSPRYPGFDVDQPMDELGTTTNFSNLGLSVGIKLNLFGNAKGE